MFMKFKNILSNFKIRTKISLGYWVLLILMVVVGVVALVQLNAIDNTVKTLANRLAEKRHLADQITGQTWKFRYYSMRYINNRQQIDLDNYRQELSMFYTLLDQIKPYITGKNEEDVLIRIGEITNGYAEGFNSLVVILANRKQAVDTLASQGLSAQDRLDNLREMTLKSGQGAVDTNVRAIIRSFAMMNSISDKYLQTNNEELVILFKQIN